MQPGYCEANGHSAQFRPPFDTLVCCFNVCVRFSRCFYGLSRRRLAASAATQSYSAIDNNVEQRFVPCRRVFCGIWCKIPTAARRKSPKPLKYWRPFQGLLILAIRLPPPEMLYRLLRLRVNEFFKNTNSAARVQQLIRYWWRSESRCG